jgi:hypothetical protein
MDRCQVIRCYGAGSLTGRGSVGGLAGSDFGGTVTACFLECRWCRQDHCRDAGATVFFDGGWDFVLSSIGEG